MDSDDSLRDSYGVQTVPLLAFITPEGRLMYTRDFTLGDDIRKIFEAMIKGEHIDTSGMVSQPG